MKYSPKHWTYGVEHELADWDARRGLPKGCTESSEFSLVNSNGIAVDFKKELCLFGGEINTPPTKTPGGQADILDWIIKLQPAAKANYRSNLHVHIRVPGLRDDLKTLKALQKYIAANAWVYAHIDPIPQIVREDWESEEDFLAAKKRAQRNRNSRHKRMPQMKIAKQMTAKTVDQFFRFEVPQVDGEPIWFLQARSAINLRQLMETDTIEFRHFHGSHDPLEIEGAVKWCREYLRFFFEDPKQALDDDFSIYTLQPFLQDFIKKNHLPKYIPFVPWMDRRYKATTADGNSPKVRADNIKLIESGKFDSVNNRPFRRLFERP